MVKRSAAMSQLYYASTPWVPWPSGTWPCEAMNEKRTEVVTYDEDPSDSMGCICGHGVDVGCTGPVAVSYE